MRGKGLIKRLTAAATALVMALSAVPGFNFLHAAVPEAISTVSDLSTINGWEEFFGDNLGTENAGGIWVDKSVFDDTDLSELTASLNATNAAKLTLSDDNNFIVALSALASTKSITGYAYTPTDTIFVLDISGSMFQNISSDDAANSSRAATMIEAANDAIKTLLANNRHNRVGVVLYSSSGNVFLPLDRYSVKNEGDDFITFNWTKTQQGGGNRPNRPVTYSYSATISTGENLLDGNGNAVSVKTQSISGGTYIQYGMDIAGDILSSVSDITVDGGSFQAGVDKMPIVVLMSDGAPTYGTASFTNVTTNNRGGSGSSSDADLAFVNQLTGAYTKYRIEQNYNKDALIYTLGVGISSDSIATSVLNPQNSVSDVLDLWETYDGLSNNGSMSISFPGSREQSLSKNANVTSADRVYVDRYFSANSTSDISSAFQQIVDQIIIQSKYYPTYVTSGDHHLDGDITFDDDIGRYMEVKAIKGIVLGDTLFSGEALAHSIDIGHLGTIESPTVLGDELVRSVRERLGVDTLTARSLLAEAYKAKQLYYNATTGEYSNYIGWYADENGNYLGFWNGDNNATAPAGAVFANKSYGFIGASGTGTSASNMMYVAVQVHTRISTGNSQVIFRIPAALIPLITYEVSLEGTSYAEATNIEVTKTMADPLRLIYEVGLKPEVNELTVKDVVSSTYEHVNSEGIYSFYTNRWDHDQHIHEDHHPEEHINTVAFYTPSEQNERYYYTEDTLIYTAQSADSVYMGATAPFGGTYYRAYYVFSNTAAKDGIEATFVEIHADALAQAKQNADGSWYIPKGVILANRGNFFVNKTSNPTGTYPFVKEPVVGGYDGVFYATSFLGNNGLLTLDPAQGIKITKTIETVEPNTNTEFTFNVTNLTDTNDNGEYRLIKQAADGTLSGEQSIFFTNGKATLTLNNGESAYIVDLVEGHTFKVEEAKHDDYRVKSVIVDGTEISEIFAEITVAKDAIAKAQFINTYIGKGLLVITKDVIHNLGADYEIPADIKFDVTVSLGTDNAGEEFDTVTETADGTVTNGKVTADANGTFTLVIEDGMSIAIDGIAEGIEYTVTEADYSAGGFVTTANGVAGNSANGTIVADDNSHVAFVNTYDPEAADATVLIHNGTKTLSGREWLDTDRFEFVVERFDGSNYAEVARVATTATDATDGTAPFSFNSYFTTAVFDTVGTHTFRISEVLGAIGGVTYSTATYDVTVSVTDVDMDGKLEIADVTSATATINHSRNNGTWEIVTPFENTYQASGGATVEISVAKTVDDLTAQATGLTLEGYQFNLYDAYGTLLDTLTTDATGLAVIERTYTAADIGKVFNYTIREVNTGVTGINYSDATHSFTVEIIDNLDGTIGATVTGATNESAEDATFAVGYVNVYEPAKTSITLSGSKTLTGIRDMVAGEFTFTVTENGTEVATGANDTAGNIIFTEIEYDYTDIGKHTYVISENDLGKGGVTYDNTTKTVVVDVTDIGGALKAEIVLTESDTVAFVNEYEAKEAEIEINATKHLTGRDLKDDDFTFKVYKGTTEVASATNKADGTIKLTFTEAEVGTHVYTVVEIDEGKGGVTYDTVPRTVTVLVEDDGNGQLTASFVGGTPHIIFANTYSTSETIYTPVGTKNLIGRNMTSGEFNFEVIDENGDLVSEGVNEADGDIIFTPIPYDTTGKHTYTVYELNDGAGGVTYSTERFTIVVEVTDDGEGNLVAALVTAESDNVVFTNTYASKGSIVLTGSKTLTGIRDMVAGEFTFSVKENGVEVATGENDANGNIIFTEIEYTEAGEHTYIITEDIGNKDGVIYDSDTVTVKVTVTDNGEGELIATIDDSSDEIAFQNEYIIHTNAKITLVGTKVLEGRDLVAGGFRFKLVGSDGTDTVLTHDADGNILFTEFTYTEPGEYTYTISEINDGIGGVTYDDAVISVTVEVSDNGDGTLSANLKDGSPEIKFTNYYTADKTSIVLEGTKELKGIRDIEPNEFTFKLVGDDGTDTTATNDEHGNFKFEKIEYSEVGTYTYTITEVDDGKNGVIYDTSVKTVIVNVTDNGYGELVATVDESSDEISFVNEYAPDSATIRIEANKLLFGKTLEDGEFTFIVREKGVEVARATNNAQGKIVFEFSEPDLGAHTYVINELDEGKEGVEYDHASHVVYVTVTDNGNGELSATFDNGAPAITFTNTYVEPVKTPVRVAIDGHKTLNGRELKAFDFTFILNTVGGDYVAEADNLATGDFTVEFEIGEVGTFEYVLTEDSSANELGMKYDNSEYRITVVVDEDANGDLYVVSKTVTKNGTDASVEFVNNFEKIDTNAYVPVSVYKQLEGRDLAHGEFSFEIYETDDSFVKKSDIPVKGASNRADGMVDFGTLTFTEEGTFHYVVSEVKGALPGVKYDNSEYRITIVITKGADSKLGYTVTYTDADGAELQRVVFKNSYRDTIPGAIIGERLRLKVKKELIDNSNTGYDKLDGFIFTLKDTSSGKEIKAVSDANGDATFEIEYVASDIGKTYVYEITEENTGIAGMVYDEAVHTVVVKVGFIPPVGKVSTYVTKDGKVIRAEAAKFVNVYNLVVEDPVEAIEEEIEAIILD